MQRHPKPWSDSLLAALVAKRDEEELALPASRFHRRHPHEALVQDAIDRAYEAASDGFRVRRDEAPRDP